MVFRNKAVSAAALVSVLALAGCSSEGSGNEEATESSNDMRTVDTAFGDVEVPQNPERVVVVRAPTLDSLLALGVEPVGTTIWNDPEAQSYLDLPADMESVGSDDEPDFEAIAALEPDLIVADETIEEQLPRLQDIAPVAAFNSANAEGQVAWTDHIEQLGTFVNDEAAASQVIEDFTNDIESLASDIEEAGDTTETVMPLRVRADEVRHYLPTSPAGAGVPQALADTGAIELPGSEVESENGTWSVIPPERLGALNADRLIAFPDSEEAMQSLEEQPLWTANEIPAVANDGVCVTDNQAAWILTGPGAADVVMEDVRECLVGSGS